MARTYFQQTLLHHLFLICCFCFHLFKVFYLLILTLNKHGLGLISVAHPYIEDTIFLGLELSLIIKLISVPTVTFLTWTIVFSPSNFFVNVKFVLQFWFETREVNYWHNVCVVLKKKIFDRLNPFGNPWLILCLTLRLGCEIILDLCLRSPIIWCSLLDFHQ